LRKKGLTLIHKKYTLGTFWKFDFDVPNSDL